MSFEPATIKVEKEKEFEQLKAAIQRVFRREVVETFLKRVRSRGLRIRELEKVMGEQMLEQVDAVLAKSGTTAQRLYDVLTTYDRAQLREFYLSRVEEVDPGLRAKYHQLYQYY